MSPATSASLAPLPNRKRVADRAYALFLERGSRHGRDAADWLEAEKALFDEFFAAAPEDNEKFQELDYAPVVVR